MEKLVILDFEDGSVHFYDVDSEADINEEYIDNLGFNTDNCYWMFAQELEIIHHKGILK